MLSQAQQNLLKQYLELLQKWNQTYNLTAIRDPEQMMTQHVMDSLSVLPYINETRLCDVGTGAGLPGIPLAIAKPETQVVLLDSNGKKTRFLSQVQTTLGLNNIEVVQSRAEDYRPNDRFHAIITRAVGPIDVIIEATKHLLHPNGRWLLMKGKYPKEELRSLAYKHQAIPLQVPGLKAERHLIILARGSDG